MIHDDFDFTLDSSDFPLSIEEFAAYMDGNLSEDEMQRVGSVIENDETMQGVMDSMEQSELTLAEYEQEDMQLPEEIIGDMFPIPNIKEDTTGLNNPNNYFRVAALAPIVGNSCKEHKITRKPPEVLDNGDSNNETTY